MSRTPASVECFSPGSRRGPRGLTRLCVTPGADVRLVGAGLELPFTGGQITSWPDGVVLAERPGLVLMVPGRVWGCVRLVVFCAHQRQLIEGYADRGKALALACGPCWALAEATRDNSGATFVVAWRKEYRLPACYPGLEAAGFEVRLADGDLPVALVYADWLEERGMGGLAGTVRKRHGDRSS